MIPDCRGECKEADSGLETFVCDMGTEWRKRLAVTEKAAAGNAWLIAPCKRFEF